MRKIFVQPPFSNKTVNPNQVSTPQAKPELNAIVKAYNWLIKPCLGIKVTEASLDGWQHKVRPQILNIF